MRGDGNTRLRVNAGLAMGVVVTVGDAETHTLGPRIFASLLTGPMHFFSVMPTLLRMVDG